MNSENELFDQLVNLEQQLHKYEVLSNPSQIANILGQNFYEFVPSGKVLSRDDIINRPPPNDDKTKIESRNFKITQLSPELALLTYISKKINTDGSSLEYLRSSVWKKHNSKWQIEFHQGTIKSF